MLRRSHRIRAGYAQRKVLVEISDVLGPVEHVDWILVEFETTEPYGMLARGERKLRGRLPGHPGEISGIQRGIVGICRLGQTMSEDIGEIVRDMALEVDVEIIDVEATIILALLKGLGESGPDVDIGIVNKILRNSGYAAECRQNDGEKGLFHV